MGSPPKLFLDTPDGPKSIRQISTEYNVNYDTVKKRYKAGVPWPELIEPSTGPGRKVRAFMETPEGRKSVVELAKEFDVPRGRLRYRILAGWTYEQLQRPSRLEGDYFHSVCDAFERDDERVKFDENH